MSTKKNIKTDKASKDVSKSEIGKYRWVIGVIVILIGVYSVLASVSYLFNWKADCSLLSGVAEIRPDITPSYGNICSGSGAFVGDLLIGRSFGLIGILIPVYLLILGFNIIRGSKRLILNRDTLTMFIILILTSLTFGALFGTSWELFGSGLGGAFGVEIAGMLFDSIGIGLILLLIGAWAATGVFINSNFINVVNKAGNSALTSTDKLFSQLKNIKLKKISDDNGDEAVNEDESDDIDDYTQEIRREQAPIKNENPLREKARIESIEPERKESITKGNQQQNIDNEDYIIAPRSINDEYATRSISSEIEAENEEESEFEEENDDDNPFIEIINSMASTKPNNEKITVIRNEPTTIAKEENNEHDGAVVFVEVNKLKEVDESEVESTLYDPTKDINNYIAPPVSLLEDYQEGVGVTDAEIYENKSKIEETLNHFGIPIQQHIKATVGPTITLYEIVQANGVKISKIQGLENDIAQRLKAFGIRIIAPIPGAGTIGVELPNRRTQIVSMRSAILSQEFQSIKAQLPIVIGRTIQNKNYTFDLAKMPHLLVAGATGQGKSVGLNAIITSLLYRKHPSELKFVMIDPKMVEFTPYKKLENHYMAKMESEEDVIITDPKKAVYALNSICEEMERRLKLLSQAGVRNIVEYNDNFRQRMLNPDKGHFFMPYIVVIIDEFADLIMTAKEVEMPVMRIAQKARAVGIHLIVATQRPDVKVITGGIKANFPARIAFKVTQMIDSRTIIDQPGANQLIGRGDMLFSKDGELTRIQCALVETEEVMRIVDHIGDQQGYSGAYVLPDYTPDNGSNDFDSGSSGSEVKYDSLFAEIARAAVSNGGISTSAIQRNFEVGFNRAGRIMTQMERAGIVGRQEGSKPREMMFYDMPSLEAKLQELGLF